MKPTKPSNLKETSPRLTTELTGIKHPWICQHCGGSPKQGYGSGLVRLTLDRWQEHDHNDKPEHGVVVLCEKCSKTIIGPHIRLYERLAANSPWPGCMSLCVDCEHRTGVSCTHKDAKANGGTGVLLSITAPTRAMIDGRNYSGPILLWPAPASGCKQKQPNPALLKNPQA